ncbi:DUF1996 domain-containing protein [Streptomyces gibsoniae]|uniref:DUF1996 domain-containing protein n=1 Tax=Streptomyces gibsoniae TaxID=3075529 RepID=A0ABU2TTD6_9ACTN|nr:DUF1996 domain-containing protein [Streptomyces sp. DSM 41699]MDT0464219.1 DUF1996 domain-containing protein [Streptomyces sp. DSM 41699]
MGGGGLVAVNVYASASEGGWGGASGQSGGDQTLASRTVTLDCPDVGQQLTQTPAKAKQQVDADLATLDKQITDAYERLASTRQAQTDDGNYVQNAILGPLKDKRAAMIDRIKTDYQQAGATAPGAIDGMAPCTGVPADQGQPPADGQSGTGQNGTGQTGSSQNSADPSGTGQNGTGQNGSGQNGQQQGNGGQAASGPVASDFVDIRSVQPNVQKPAQQGDASTGSFVTKCGVNANGNHNTDNVIVAPGVKNGAHHLHDYVGNQSNDAFATNDTFAAAQTSCENQGDKSSYYWPVLRVQDGTQDFDQNNDGGGKEGNIGKILVAKKAQITFVGSPTSKVVAMPRFLRIITGDAKAFTNGPANANAHWSCTGFEDRQLTDKYPICPSGSSVVRSFAFQSCWDGQNIDSANHRTHVAFADANGNCQNGFKAIPQLTMRLVYDVPPPVLENGQVKNPYAVDGFPEQLHKPATDHDDFINVMTDELMGQVVDCINNGRQCGGGSGDSSQNTPPPSDPSSGGNSGSGQGSSSGGNSGSGQGSSSTGGNSGSDQGSSSTGGNSGSGQGSSTGHNSGAGAGSSAGGNAGSGSSAGDHSGSGSGSGGGQTAQPTTGTTGAAGAGTGSGGGNGAGAPRVFASASAAHGEASAAPQGSSGDSQSGSGAAQPSATAQPSAAAGGYAPTAPPQTEPQAVTGGLAETGANLWPAAGGAVLVIAGLVLLRRIARRPARY